MGGKAKPITLLLGSWFLSRKMKISFSLRRTDFPDSEVCIASFEDVDLDGKLKELLISQSNWRKRLNLYTCTCKFNFSASGLFQETLKMKISFSCRSEHFSD